MALLSHHLTLSLRRNLRLVASGKRQNISDSMRTDTRVIKHHKIKISLNRVYGLDWLLRQHKFKEMMVYQASTFPSETPYFYNTKTKSNVWANVKQTFRVIYYPPGCRYVSQTATKTVSEIEYDAPSMKTPVPGPRSKVWSHHHHLSFNAFCFSLW